MDINYIRRLVKLVADSGVSELEIEEEGNKIRIAKISVVHSESIVAAPTPVVAPVAAPAPIPEASPVEARIEKKLHQITSPIVGTFYRAPAPDADVYIQVGQEIQVGSVLCIIEAMKLMNEIESDVSGRIVKILVENGQPVEYNQPMFSIELH